MFVKIDPSPKGHPSLLDIAWAAGIYEGEGSISRYGNKKLIVRIAQKDTFILERFTFLFGGKFYKNSRGIHIWCLLRAQALGFMFSIFTFLSPRRREQFRRCLETEIPLRWGKLTESQVKGIRSSVRSFQELADENSVSKQAIKNVKSGKSYGYVR